VARWADGLLAWSFAPDIPSLTETYRIMTDGWRDAGRPGAPRFIAGFWYALGPKAEDRIEQFARRYLAYFGDDNAKRTAKSITTHSPDRIKDILAALADMGTDEAIPVPVSGDLAQLELLAELVA